MDVRFFNTFIEVAKTKHFGKAAENLYLTQSAVSARIKQLEEYFNAPLFIRERHSIRLTSTGERLLPFAESMVVTLNDARRALQEVDVQLLSTAATSNAWHLLFSHLYAATNHHFPELTLKSDVVNTEQLSRQLHERTVDIVFSLEKIKSDDAETLCIGNLELGLYHTHDADPAEALNNLIHINWGDKISALLFGEFPKLRQACFSTSSIALGLQVLNQRECASIVLPHNIATSVTHPQGQLIKAQPISGYLSLYVSRLKNAQHSALDDIFQFYASPLTYSTLFQMTQE
ncbi:LysR family transcriptional regulator [Alteromonas sediminis]|uniref:LysR family transcriptional regulator n=1 Tax=Alteromonas sediminis TaxID=2259342 RepID=A0A3N5Z8Y1_9ALTE|nr:LysR family transcriptional regulator [Alteromonas sediminis]RPJ67364.1 LysR family transcriptional regulator [Alteromonas sediminis]